MSSLLIIIPVALVLVTLQATVVERFTIAGVPPDLILVSILLLTMISGRAAATLAVIIIAPISDAISGLPLGTSILPLLTVVYLAGFGESSLFGTRLGWPVVVAIAGTILAGLITLFELSLLGWNIQWSDTFLRILLPSVVLNAVLVFLLYIPTDYLRERRTLSLR